VTHELHEHGMVGALFTAVGLMRRRIGHHGGGGHRKHGGADHVDEGSAHAGVFAASLALQAGVIMSSEEHQQRLRPALDPRTAPAFRELLAAWLQRSEAAAAGTPPPPPLVLAADVSFLAEAFAAVDYDRSGKIERNELLALLRSLGTHATPAELAAMIREIDIDRDGAINFTEFFVFMAFRWLDGDGNSRIVADDLRAAAASVDLAVSGAQCAAMLEHADHGGDGTVRMGEFAALWRGLAVAGAPARPARRSAWRRITGDRSGGGGGSPRGGGSPKGGDGGVSGKVHGVLRMLSLGKRHARPAGPSRAASGEVAAHADRSAA